MTMPTRNNIRVQLARNRTNAKVLVSQLPDVDRVAMSYIEQGRVLPTKDTLSAMTELLDCSPADLYDLSDIDLAPHEKASHPLHISPASHDHNDMERVYIWYPAGGKDALFAVIKQLDYPSVAEWFRDMARITFLKAAGLEGKTLHEAATEVNREKTDA
jgi:DNA-binding Xre family transcriptional regulator